MDSLEVDDVFELDGEDYITLDKTVYNGTVYLLIN